jgi:hypothetical protein
VKELFSECDTLSGDDRAQQGGFSNDSDS